MGRSALLRRVPKTFVRRAALPHAEYTRGLSREAISLLFKYLPRAYANGANDFEAREKVHYAATIAGMAFANAFLGICHSLAHKLGEPGKRAGAATVPAPVGSYARV